MNQLNTAFAAWPFTPLVKRLILINAAVWGASVLLVVWMGIPGPYEALCLTPADVVHKYRVWQLFTYMWLHDVGGFGHLLFNLLFLWMFGGVLEQSWGARAFLKFYLICGIGAGLVVLVAGYFFYPVIPTAGASGAIYGLVIAWAIAFPERQVYIFGVFPLKGKYFALIPIGYAFLDFFTRGSGASHAAHLGGLAIGALLVTGYWRPRRISNRIRYAMLRKKLRILDGQKRDGSADGPPNGGYWN